MTHRKLNHYYTFLDAAQARLLRQEDGTNTADILFLYRYLEGIRVRMEDAPTLGSAIAEYRAAAGDLQARRLIRQYFC